MFPDTLGGSPPVDPGQRAAARPRLSVTEVERDALSRSAARLRRSAASISPASRRCARICLRSDESEHVLLLLLHHIAGDGWSLAPLAATLPRLCGTPQRPGAGACRRCRCSTPTTRCGSMRCWARRAIRRARSRASSRSGRRRSRIFPISSSCRPTGRGRRCRAIAATRVPLRRCRQSCTAACWRWRDDERASLFMVLQAALAALLHAAGRGHRHPDRQPDRGAHRRRARRSGRLLRQHAGAAHRHVGQSELPRADRAGAREQPGGLQPPGPAVRAPGRGAQPGALAGAASAVPGDAGVPEQRAGPLRRSAGPAHGASSRSPPSAPSSTSRSASASSARRTARRRGSMERSNTRPTCSIAATRRGDGAAASFGCSRPRIADPERAIGRLDILGARGAPHDPARRGTTPRARSGPPTLPELFAAQVATTPDAIAVVFEERALTYARARRARQPAGASPARARASAPRWWSGCASERSLEMVVGLLGILKAGGAYLPLDPDYPAERLAFMLADAGAPLLVTQSALRRSAARARRPHRAGSMPTGPPSPSSLPAHQPALSDRRTPPTSSTPRAPRDARRASSSRIAAFAISRQPRSSASPSRPMPASFSSHRRASTPRSRRSATS